MKIFTLSLISILLIFTSCKKDQPVDNTAARFDGHWTGTFAGDDNGTWDAIIINSGIVNVTILENSITDSIHGSVTSSGSFYATSGNVTTGSIFSGTLTDNTGSGTWYNSVGIVPRNGTWTGAKH